MSSKLAAVIVGISLVVGHSGQPGVDPGALCISLKERRRRGHL